MQVFRTNEKDTTATLGRLRKKTYELNRIAGPLFAVDQQRAAQLVAVPDGMRGLKWHEPACLPPPLTLGKALTPSPEP